MKANEIIRLNQVIGKALVETAHEAYLRRLEKMYSTPFDTVMDEIKNKKALKNKGNGYYIDDAIGYFDNLLEKEDEETWLEVDTCDDDWFEAIEQFRW